MTEPGEEETMEAVGSFQAGLEEDAEASSQGSQDENTREATEGPPAPPLPTLFFDEVEVEEETAAMHIKIEPRFVLEKD